MSDVENIIKCVRRQWPAAAVRTNGISFYVVDQSGELVSGRHPTANRAWTAAYRLMQANR